MHSPAASTEMLIATAMAGIALILIAGSLLGNLMKRFRQPPVIGEIAAGILLGPSVLGLFPGDLPQRIFPADVRPLLSAVAQCGLLLFIFLIGWEFEKSLLRKRTSVAVAVSLSSVVLSFALGAGLGFALYSRHSTVEGEQVPTLAFALFLGAAMSVTAFPVLARILTDNRLMHTRVGALALASAAVDDVLAWCVLALVSVFVTAGSPAQFAQILGLSFVYIVVMFTVVKPLLAFLVRRLTRTRVSPSLLPVLTGGAFLSAYATSWIGIHAIFGAFLFGFIMPREPVDDLQVHLRRPLETAGRLLLPVFFITTGLGVDIGSLTWQNYVELVAILAIACAGKLIGAGASARAFGMTWREAGTLGLLMNTRGLTELIILNAGVSLGVLDTPMFTMMVIMALSTTALAGPLLPRTPTTGTVPWPAPLTETESKRVA